MMITGKVVEREVTVTDCNASNGGGGCDGGG